MEPSPRVRSPFPNPPINLVNVADDGTSSATILLSFDAPTSVADFASSQIFLQDPITSAFGQGFAPSQIDPYTLSILMAYYTVTTIPPGQAWTFAPSANTFTPGQTGSTS